MAGSPSSDVVSAGLPDPERIRETIDQLPDFRAYPLKPRNGTMQLCVMPEAWRGADRSLDNPGSAREYWFEDEEILVVDLSQP